MNLKTFIIVIGTCILFTGNVFAGGEKTKKDEVSSVLGIATNFLTDTFLDLSVDEWEIYLKSKDDITSPSINLGPLIDLDYTKIVPGLTKDEWEKFIRNGNEEQYIDLMY